MLHRDRVVSAKTLLRNLAALSRDRASLVRRLNFFGDGQGENPATTTAPFFFILIAGES